MNELLVEIILENSVLHLRFVDSNDTEVDKITDGGSNPLTGITHLAWRCALGDFEVLEVNAGQTNSVYEQESGSSGSTTDDPHLGEPGIPLDNGAADYLIRVNVNGAPMTAAVRFGRKLKVN